MNFSYAPLTRGSNEAKGGSTPVISPSSKARLGPLPSGIRRCRGVWRDTRGLELSGDGGSGLGAGQGEASFSEGGEPPGPGFTESASSLRGADPAAGPGKAVNI